MEHVVETKHDAGEWFSSAVVENTACNAVFRFRPDGYGEYPPASYRTLPFRCVGGAVLIAKAIDQGYGRTLVLENFSITLGPGVTALLGPNGAGKSTLLQTLATALPPREGELIVDSLPVTSERSARLARRNIGYLPQEFGFESRMRVRDFVTYGAWVRGVPAEEWPRATQQVFGYVGLEEHVKTRMGKLSGGMRQRAGIAWALVGRPKVVLLDEPTVGLDPEQRMHFRHCLSGLRETTVLLSTHLTDDVDAICDKAAVLSDGHLLFHATTSWLRDMDRHEGPGHTPIERAYIRLLAQNRHS